MIKINRKFKSLVINGTRFFIVTGGRGSAKSFSVSSVITRLSFEAGHKILYTRQTMTSAHLSIIPEFEEKVDLMGFKVPPFNINKTEIVNRISGSGILFRGLRTSSGDQTANLKSLQGVTTWVVDEAEELVDEAMFDKINLSIRKKGKRNIVILILNPATKEHWIYKRFFEQAGVKEGFNGQKGNVTYIHTTYLDNIKHLAQSFIDEVNHIKLTRPLKYAHTILGGWLDKAEGVVFTNWKYGKFNPDNLQTGFGQDFGFSVDPTTLIEVAIDRKKKILYVKSHLHKAGLTTSEIGTANLKAAGRKLIVADSAEPRLINELGDRSNRNNIVPAIKGPGSVTAGTEIMRDYLIIVEEESTCIGSELNNHVYSDRKSKQYVDAYNHCLDAIRYYVFYMLSGSKGVDIR